ncbi:MAG: hypothetical protein EOO75_16440, partial [Myxococcales bacterium]
MAATSSPGAGNAGVYRYTFDGTSWAYANDAYANGGLYIGSSLRLRDGLLAIGDNGTSKPRLHTASTQPTWPLLATLASPSGPVGAPVDVSQDRIAVAALNGDGFVDIGALRLGPGSDCAAGDECASGFCVDGVCCNKACDAGACDACSAATGASADGACTLLTGTVCDDGDACTQTDACQAGVCKGGAATPCSDGNACTSDACDPATGCVFVPVADETTCDDGNACNSGDRCVAGACQPVS